MRVSILIMAFLPPLRADTSASSARAPVSLHWASSSFLSFSRAMESSCSQRSSSASLAASTIARAAFSSDSLASLLISSRSLLSWLYSDSSFLLAAAMGWLTLLRSARFSLVSASSCSAPRLCLSAVSRRARLSSRAFAMAADFLSAVTLLSAAADLASVSRADCMESRALVWFFLTIANSSSFSAMRRSISVLTWVSSIWHLSTLFSSCSRVASASSRADWSSIFSLSNPPSSWSRVDGAASLGDLVHDVLDLVGQGLVLTSDLLKLEDSLLISGLNLEQLRRGVPGLLLAHIKVEGQAVNLALVLRDGLVKLLGLPLHGGVNNLGLVEVGGHLIDLLLNLALGLLNLGELGIEVINGSLSLGVPGGKLHLSHLKLLGLGNSIHLILLTHGGGITLSLGVQSEDSLAARSLLIKSLLSDINLMLEVPVLAKEELSVPGLIVAQCLDIIELGTKSSLGSSQHLEVVLKVANNAEKLSILVSNLVLGHAEVSKGQVGGIDLLVDGIKSLKQILVGLVSGSLASANLISGGSGISDLSHDGLLVLVNLGLHLLQGVSLLLHLEDRVSLLPLQVAEDRLAGNVGLLNVLAQLDDLRLALLVELALGDGGAAGLIVSVSELLNLTGEVRSLALSLGTGLTLGLKLLLGSLNTGLELLNVLLGLGHQGLLIIKLG